MHIILLILLILFIVFVLLTGTCIDQHHAVGYHAVSHLAVGQ